MKELVGFLAIALAIPSAIHAGDTWPCWRGPTGMGITEEKDLPVAWGGSNEENILWKSPLPGAQTKAKQDRNQSSPIVWKDRIFLIAAFWPEGVEQSEYAEHHVACYAADDGRLLWDVVVPPGPWMLKDLRGGYAAPTPCTDGERIYVLFGSSELAALDFRGQLLWRKAIEPFAWDVAIGTSPVLTSDAVLVLVDGTKRNESRLVAFDRATGEIKWQQSRPDAGFNHTTPLAIDVNGKPQLVIASSGALQGVNPTDGAVIWWAKHKGDVPTPAYGGGLVYSENGRGGPGIAIDPTGEGDVSTNKVKWVTSSIPEGYSSPSIAGGYVYRTHNPGILRCADLATGEKVYDARLSGVNGSTSPITTADGRIYFAGGGKSVVVPVGPKYEPLATNDLGDDGAASPAVAHGRLYLKGSRFLYCIGKKAETTP